MNVKSIGIITATLLFLALFTGLPIQYFTLLRWIVCASALYFAYNFHQTRLLGWTLIFVGIAVVFNPVFPVYLTKSGWAPIDVIAAVLFLLPLTKKVKHG